MEAIVLTRSLPMPGNPGESRFYRLLDSLRGAGFETHFLSLIERGQEAADIQHLSGVCRWAHTFERLPRRKRGMIWSWFKSKSFTVTRDWQPGLIGKMKELFPKVDVFVCVDAVFYPMILRAAGGIRPEPFFMADLAEPLSLRLSRRASDRHGPAAWALRREARMVSDLETALANMADLTLVGDQSDLQMVAKRVRTGRLWCVTDGVSVTDGLSGGELTDLPNRMMFCGDSHQADHQQSAVWFVKQVLPKLRRAVPDAELVVFADRVPRLIRGLGRREGVDVVDTARRSASLATTMSGCVAGVAPQRMARGARTNTLMMMSIGRPVVCTSAVAHQLPDDSAAAPQVAESAAEFAEYVGTLLLDRQQAARDGARARALIEQCATWDAQWRRVGAVLTQVANPEPVDVVGELAKPRDPDCLRANPIQSIG